MCVGGEQVIYDVVLSNAGRAVMANDMGVAIFGRGWVGVLVGGVG